MVRRGWKPCASSASTASRIDTTLTLSSRVPRPRISPSTTSPLNGLRFQSFSVPGTTGTTSKCPMRTAARRFPAEGTATTRADDEAVLRDERAGIEVRMSTKPTRSHCWCTSMSCAPAASSSLTRTCSPRGVSASSPGRARSDADEVQRAGRHARHRLATPCCRSSAAASVGAGQELVQGGEELLPPA